LEGVQVIWESVHENESKSGRKSWDWGKRKKKKNWIFIEDLDVVMGFGGERIWFERKGGNEDDDDEDHDRGSNENLRENKGLREVGNGRSISEASVKWCAE
jgi:hypothetical protein